MKTHAPKVMLPQTSQITGTPDPSHKEDRGTDFAFLFLMGMLALGLLYFFLLPFLA